MERLGGKMERFGRLLLGAVVWAAMMLGFACTAQAYENNPYERFVLASSDNDLTVEGKTVRFGGYDWYIIEDNSTAANAGSVTLLAKKCLGAFVMVAPVTDIAPPP